LEPLNENEITIEYIDGGRAVITINVKEPITLIPWSELQPRIIMSSPERGSIVDRAPNRDITVTFASAAAIETLVFRPGHIEIRGKLADPGMPNPPEGFSAEPVSMESYFATPIYNEGNHTLTIQSKGAIPVGLIIEVKLGKNILSPGGDKGLNGTVLQYRTVSPVNTISSWKALYNEENEQIEINWEIPSGADKRTPVVRYRENNGDTRTFILDNDETSFTINATKPNDRNVRDGIPSSGFNNYTITLTLDEEPTLIVIWNIPGMELRQNWSIETKDGLVKLPDITLTEISTEDELLQLCNNVNSGNNFSQNKVYILTRSISIINNWVPIGTAVDNQRFQGNFYGNGHTLTVQNGFAGTSIENGGVFGVIYSAVIRDLTVVYPDTTVTGANATLENPVNVGGIIGWATGNTQILNCIVRGATENSVLTLNANSTTGNPQVYFGGIIGLMRGTTSIINCYSALNINLNNSSGANTIRVGGVVGLSSGNIYPIPPPSTICIINEITVIGTVSLNKTDGLGGNILLGGIVGSLSLTNLSECLFNGKIEIPDTFNTSGSTQIGGLSGSLGNSNAENCSVTGDITIHSVGTGSIYLGGVLGYVGFGTIRNSSYSDGTISFNTSGINEWHYIGGFFGSAQDADIKDCNSNALSIIAQVTNPGISTLYIGGFLGMASQSNISNCKSSSSVIIPSTHLATGGVKAGGFSGMMRALNNNASGLTECSSTGNVYVHIRNTVTTPINHSSYIGGLVGLMINSTTNEHRNFIDRCYATGDVTVTHHADGSFPGVGVGGLIGLAQYTEINESFAAGNVIVRKGTGGTMPLIAGGLVGFLGWTSDARLQMSSITNSYALGNVSVDNPNDVNAALYAGGLVGYMQINDANSVTNSFAAGSVSARNANSDAITRVGGLIGHRQSGIIQNNAALGASVNVQGGSDVTGNRTAARIYGFPTSNIGSNNYALRTMIIEADASYSTLNPESRTAVSGLDTPDGANTSLTSFYTQNFWTGTSPNGLGFPITVWDFSTVIGRGYPVLRGLLGQ